jgi:hypothetical protein
MERGKGNFIIMSLLCRKNGTTARGIARGKPFHRNEGNRGTRTMVGIELGRVCVRRRVTSLALSVARWVHNSALATFSEAPLLCRTAEFPRSGWKSWHLVRKPSHSPPGSSAGSHTPRLRMVCSQLSSISCVRLRSALCPTTALNMEPPSAQSPFA